jgi:hypothetical protein
VTQPRGEQRAWFSAADRRDYLLDAQQEMAVDLGEWCELCHIRIATLTSEDGVNACLPCAESYLAGPNRNQRRAAKRAEKQRGRGVTR